jgi:beta-glucosidase/6-phospho-beta-glucosidase/beta-galactosidase
MNEPTTDAGRVGNYRSAHNVVMAHARIVHWYREHIRGTGKWSIKLSLGAAGVPLPLDPSDPDDIDATNRRLDFSIGIMARPLYLGLDTPDSVKATLGPNASSFTAEELAIAKGTCDFFAFDLYAATYQTSPPESIATCAANKTSQYFPICTIFSPIRAGWQIGAEGNGGQLVFAHKSFASIQVD